MNVTAFVPAKFKNNPLNLMNAYIPACTSLNRLRANFDGAVEERALRVARLLVAEKDREMRQLKAILENQQREIASLRHQLAQHKPIPKQGNNHQSKKHQKQQQAKLKPMKQESKRSRRIFITSASGLIQTVDHQMMDYNDGNGSKQATVSAKMQQQQSSSMTSIEQPKDKASKNKAKGAKKRKIWNFWKKR
eukprot:TRINITY_DN3350_c0_g2_i3.p1 TRINITY_DN3350_c0_g2~~TRINITY_DN3350_c0_g2_i3.p1  ORF type:complete len:192 (-),score=49.65 TRINITY_DN3350_c0_g2_i3:164-739(-)